MRINPEHKLRRLGKHYMIVDACASNTNLTNVYVLNATAAFLWESVGDTEFDAEMLANLLCENYEVEPEQARADVDALLDVWCRYKLILL